jgi:serine protease Do
MKTTMNIGKITALAVMAALLAGSTVFAATDTEELQLLKKTSRAFSAVSKKAMPAVVSVQVEKTLGTGGRGGVNPYNQQDQWNDLLRQFFGQQFGAPEYSPRQYKQMGQGSGFLISKDGYILTNNHVVGDADRIRVRLHDGREFDAKRVGSDAKSEVAVIKIEGNNFPYLQLGDSDGLDIGEWVIAIGSPFGLSETVTVGIVSAKGRSGVRITDYEDFIQTDAAINPGNSGGPLLNIDGDVIGINTAIFSQSGGYMGIGFAIPGNMAKSIMDQLIKKGKVVRGYLGIMLQEVTPELAESLGMKESKGILVADVERGSPADKAGIRQADVLLKLDGKDIESVAAFRGHVSSMPPGTEVVLQLRRDGKLVDIRVRTIELPEDGLASAGDSGAGNTAAGKLGLHVQDLTRDMARRYGYDGQDGVIVSEVEEGSAAEMAGLQAGNLITSVNRRRVSNEADFRQALASAKDGAGILLTIKEGRFNRYVVIRGE